MSSDDLDPRIQIELENLNSATDEINKLEIELEEANSTFRILLNESTRRLKLSSKKLGNCIEKARPYYEALEKAREAQIECQKAAVKFQRANEIHAAAKETVALAEQRFMSNSHEWQFDNAWQEMLNHATQKVMDAEKRKTDCHTEHQRRTRIFHTAEQKVQQLEERFRRSIAKSRPYFEEKQICQDQLQTQKNRIQELQTQVQAAKSTYSTALRNLERISDDIHRQRGDYPTHLGHGQAPPPGPREPGVGAELNTPTSSEMPPLPDFHLELEKCDYSSIAGSQMSLGASSQRSSEFACMSSSSSSATAKAATNAANDEDFDFECEADYADNDELNGLVDEKDLEALRQKVRRLAVRPIEGGDGQQEQNDMWEHELNATVDKLDHLMLLKECARNQEQQQQQLQQHLKFKPQQQQCMLRPESLGAEAPTPATAATNLKQSIVKVTTLNNLNKNINEKADSNNIVDYDDDDDRDVVLVTSPKIQISSCIDDLDIASLPTTPKHHNLQPIKKLKKLEPLPLVNVSMRELPLLARLSNDVLNNFLGNSNNANNSSNNSITAHINNTCSSMKITTGGKQPQRRRSLD